MSENKGVNVAVDNDFAWAIVIAFFMLWWQSGWYRIDCALGVERACQLISAEKEYAEPVAK